MSDWTIRSITCGTVRERTHRPQTCQRKSLDHHQSVGHSKDSSLPFPAPRRMPLSCIKSFSLPSSPLDHFRSISSVQQASIPPTPTLPQFPTLLTPKQTLQNETPRRHPNHLRSSYRGSISRRCLHRHLLRRVPRAVVRCAQDQQYRHFLRWGLCQWRLCLKGLLP
jgi:hypothetical protein